MKNKQFALVKRVEEGMVQLRIDWYKLEDDQNVLTCLSAGQVRDIIRWQDEHGGDVAIAIYSDVFEEVNK